MKICVCGGREYADHEYAYEFLDSVLFEMRAKGERITHVIHGDARGADKLAHGWAVNRGIQPVRVPALWEIFGPKAGALRNRAMLDLKPDLLVAFPGGAGTSHMVKIARESGALRIIEAIR